MKYTPEELNLITLSSIPELNYKEKYTALSALTTGRADIEPIKNSLIKRYDIGVYNRVKEQYCGDDFRKNLLDQLEKRDIVCVTYFSDGYPEALKKLKDPPVTLFLKGNRELLNNKCFSIVGSRKSAFYACNGAKKFAKEISQYFTIVSGFAPGADSSALEGADYKAVSVIAFGFDHIGSLANYEMLKKVEANGLLVSEYFPTVAPQTYLFPIRNRIIAGLSAGTLVVSAGLKSGALITANHAISNGRDVFAFPYAMTAADGAGCNNLIHDGAILCRGVQDILGFYGILPPPQKRIELTEEEELVLGIIGEEGEAFINTLSQRLNLPPFKLIPVLSALEIKGLVARIGGNRYTIC